MNDVWIAATAQAIVIVGAAWAFTLRMERRLTRIETFLWNVPGRAVKQCEHCGLPLQREQRTS